MNRSFVTLGLVVAVLAAVAGLQAQQASVSTNTLQPAFGGHGQLKPPALLKQFVGGGKWQSQRSIASLSDRAIGALTDSGNDSMNQWRNDAILGWQVQLKHLEDGSLSGRVVIVGSPVLDHAEIQGQVTGSEVDGVLLDDGGRQVGTFSGSIANGTVGGTYSTADGDVGDWSWEGKIPN
jgi:hypothetical protein